MRRRCEAAGKRERRQAMILMIDNYDSFTYNLVQEFRELGADMQVVRNDKITIEEIEAMKPEGIVLSPGPGNPDSAGITLAAIRHFAGKLPLFGICLGHQSIAQAFGAKVVGAKRLMHGKTSKIAHDGKGVFAGLQQGFAAMRYHSLAVERETLPGCLEVTATSEDGEIMGIRHKEFAVEGVQYHPESVGTPEGMLQLRNFLDAVHGKAPAAPRLGNAERREMTGRLVAGENLTEEEAHACFAGLMRGDESEGGIAAILTAFYRKGVTTAELTGAARAMREEGVKIDAGGLDTVDVVGTGGDGANTFNVSTTAAFIAAGAGVAVAKHGNGASTSQCGAADVLGALGYNLAAAPEKVSECLKRTNICFLFARNLHPAMRYAAPVRKALPFRTIFNLLGPLTNPAGAKRHLIGACSADLTPRFAETLRALGSVRADVVSGDGGLDEISPGGITFVSSLKDGEVRSTLLDAGRIYGESYPASAIRGGDAKENAQLLLRVLRGEDRGAFRMAAAVNGAAAILVGGKAETMEEALEMAKESIDSGAALGKLEAMIGAAK